MKRGIYRFRLWIQIAFAALSNGYVAGFFKTRLYSGALKQVCLPGLNCYACPGALGSCPIGALQSVLGDRNFKMSFYVLGTLMIFGALLGRLVCGFLCPFGLVQDLLHKIPSKKIQRMPLDRWLRWLKYVVLAVFVLWLPLFAVNIVGQGSPWFCKWICPSGTLMGGIPQMLMSESLRESAGFLFSWKMFILLALLTLSVFSYRPFCKYLCPLGAIYAVTNRFSLFRFQLDERKCTHCGACARSCKMGVNMSKTQNHPECIRCGDCQSACPEGAISSGFTHTTRCSGQCSPQCSGASPAPDSPARDHSPD
ncbi:4Fe-4S binding protein [Eubacteriales bacterium OttesenSCG-928-N13]|nr:4Fe-4S binding protein [Eubacteriales bacterium OttesenSCG-928-N13]